MVLINSFFRALGINKSNKLELSQFSKKSGISIKKLRYFNDENIMPSGVELERVLAVTNISEIELMLRMGVIDHSILELLSKHADKISKLFNSSSPIPEQKHRDTLVPVFKTGLGELYQTDCLDLLKQVPSNSIDMVFADPPFNLNKLYPSEINDDLKSENYIKWCETWINECIRVLKFNGSFFLWNLPKWRDRKSTRLNSSHTDISRMPSSA